MTGQYNNSLIIMNTQFSTFVIFLFSNSNAVANCFEQLNCLKCTNIMSLRLCRDQLVWMDQKATRYKIRKVSSSAL